MIYHFTNLWTGHFGNYDKHLFGTTDILLFYMKMCQILSHISQLFIGIYTLFWHIFFYGFVHGAVLLLATLSIFVVASVQKICKSVRTGHEELCAIWRATLEEKRQILDAKYFVHRPNDPQARSKHRSFATLAHTMTANINIVSK